MKTFFHYLNKQKSWLKEILVCRARASHFIIVAFSVYIALKWMSKFLEGLSYVCLMFKSTLCKGTQLQETIENMI